MVGPSTTPSRTKEKQQIFSFGKSDTEPEGVYRHTRTRNGVVASVDYSAQAQGIKVKESHFCHCRVTCLKLFRAFAYMASTPEEMARRFEQQAQTQREQLDMIMLNKNQSTASIKCFRNCLRGKNLRPRQKSKGKRKEGESSSSTHTEEEEHSSELSKPSSEEEDNSENTSTHSKRMSAHIF